MERIAMLERAYSQKEKESVSKGNDAVRLEGMLNTVMSRFEKLESSLANKEVPASSVGKETVAKGKVPNPNRNPEFAEQERSESESDGDEEDYIQTANGDKVTLIDLY